MTKLSTEEYASDYFNWLIDIIDDGYASEYTNVLEDLFSTEFYSLVDHDENRAVEGLDLRNRYAELVGEHVYYISAKLPRECTILEMMVALSIKWDTSNAFDFDIGSRYPKWFWIMFENLGLYSYPDWEYDEVEVHEILTNFLARNFEKSGRGSLFVVKNPKIDMRETEIWYQINYYFSENMDKF